MGVVDRIMKIGCVVGFFVGVVGFTTCLFTEDMSGALTWGVIALLNQNAMNATN